MRIVMIKVRLLMKGLLSVALASIGAVITLECVVRNVQFRISGTRVGADGRADPVMKVVWRREGYGISHWNADGVRSLTKCPMHDKPILAFGDSFTEAYQVNDSEVFTTLLEDKLKASGISSPVLNLGFSGGALPQYISSAKQYVEKYSPQWTVVQLRDWDLTKEAWSVERPIRFERDKHGNGIYVVNQEQRNLARSKVYQAYSLLCSYAALPRYAYERISVFRGMFEKEAPLFRAGYANTSSATHELDLNKYPLSQEIELVREAYGGRLSILYIAPYEPSDPMAASPMETELSKICRLQKVSFVTTRSLHERFKSLNKSPFGFPNSTFNAGHCNRDGHQAMADLLADELNRVHRK